MSYYKDQPEEVKEVYDNKGETIDRYTIQVIYDNGEAYIIGSSDRPTHPVFGVWHMDFGYVDPDNVIGEIGEEIGWEDLPEEVKRTVVHYVKA